MAAMRTLEDLMETLRAFQESRVLLTALELDLFHALGDGSTAAQAADRAGTDARATEMLLNALVALGALEKQNELFRCTSESRTFAVSRAEHMHTVRRWDTWSTLTECVRTGTTARKPETGRDMEGTEHFIGAMHARALRAAAQLVETVGAGNVTRMLDLGGGPGTFSIALAQANPELTGEVLDLAAVVPIAERHIREAGLSERLKTRIGDLRTDLFGQGYDLILASAVCHILDEGENRDLFRRCAHALVPGGRLVIREFILEPDRTQPKAAALFALNMLTGTARGNVYTEADYRKWLGSAGFRTITRLRNGEDLIIASRV
jgi:2-polyprenyl-3-methyl-5-hydroxy-6-metoxy-1,4-benzoquinol methylase